VFNRKVADLKIKKGRLEKFFYEVTDLKIKKGKLEKFFKPLNSLVLESSIRYKKRRAKSSKL
jgi:hypothetical protein